MGHPKTLEEQIRSNRFRTFALFVIFFALIAAVAFLSGAVTNYWVTVIIITFGVCYSIYAWFGAWRVAASMTKARASEGIPQPLLDLLETASVGAGLTKPPQLRIVDDLAPNAFSLGCSPDSSLVCVTSGLLRKLDKREVEAVLAHEVAHIRSRDVRLMTLAVALVGVLTILSDFTMRCFVILADRRFFRIALSGLVDITIGLVVLAPIAAAAMQLAISRQREYLADETAAQITGDPEGLALALRELLWDSSVSRYVARSTALLYIESPLRASRGLLGVTTSLFETHPALEARIERLEEIGGFALDIEKRVPAHIDLTPDGTVGNPGAGRIRAVGTYAPLRERLIFCSHCGHDLGPDGHCTNCGKASEITSDGAPTPEKPKHPDDPSGPPLFVA